MKFHIQGMPQASVELTGDELRVLQWAARSHYDGKCKDQVHWLQFERDWLRDIGCARGTTMLTFDRHRDVLRTKIKPIQDMLDFRVAIRAGVQEVKL